ncbi:MAG TPA: cellulose-binding domain-containing protein [Pseudonocardiaceae bacterium]|nr:cellulose-binding domain-containing protein [Pseudonocardiaceae bacterium]
MRSPAVIIGPMRTQLAVFCGALSALALVAIVVPNSAPAAGGPLCQVTDQVNQWSTGFTSNLTVTNNGPALTTWTVTWTFGGNQQVTSAWNAQVTQAGSGVTATNASFNGVLPTGGSVSFGFQATYSGANGTPADFAVNGQPCNGTGTPTTTPPTTTPVGSGCTAGSAIFCDGFDDQAGATPSGRWSVATPNCSGTGTASIDGTVAHTGSKSLKIVGTDGFCNHVFAADPTDPPAAAPTWFVRFWIRHTTALPTGHVTFLAMNNSAAGNTDLRLGGQNGALMWNRQSDDATLPDQSPAGVAQSVPLPVNTWTCVEFSVSGATGQIQTWVDGTAVPGLTEDGVPTQNVDDQWLAGSGASWRPNLTDLKLGWESYGGGGPDNLWFDDVALGTSRIGC